MWSRAVRSRCHPRPWKHATRNILPRRNYNGTPGQGGHTTYFQQPPPPPPRSRARRIFTTLLWTTLSFGAGSFAAAYYLAAPLDALSQLTDDGPFLGEVLSTAALDALAREAPPLSVEEATELLEARASYSVSPKAVAHTCQSPSNLPCEDSWSTATYTLFNDIKKDWAEWSIFDGHAGPRTAQLLKQALPSLVGQALWDAKCMQRAYMPNDLHTIRIMKQAFLNIDKDIVDGAAKRIESGGPLADVIATGASAFSGSCALLALYDPARDVLRVANVGDSRAVLGRWDGATGGYVAHAMSVDQTGFNPDEVARIAKDHPGEDDVVDPNTGRVHGIAISRAFGDARWKWPSRLSGLAHDKFWGPNPRPEKMIQTPPYLTAEPEIMEAKIQTSGDHPDFLIMASDGLWDQITSEDAVTCVQMWLDKNEPMPEDFFKWKDYLSHPNQKPERSPTFTSATDLAADDDTYFDEDEKCLKWRTSPKHFVVEDEHCAVHLIKNALGGKRRNLFTGVLSVQPPLSRNVRDDITVHIIFFGVDTDAHFKER